MKKIINLLGLFLIFASVANAQFDMTKLTVYGGVSILPVKTVDFEDFHISDWENYGLGTSEGRVLVPLETNKPKSMSIGVLLGANYELSEKLNALLEINYAVSGISITQALVGINYSLVDNDKISLGFTPKVGYTIASAEFGAIEVLPNKTPPVILPEGTFYEGDLLTMEMAGINVQLGFNAKYKITEQIGAFANVYYGLSFGSEGALMASGLEIPMTANGVVKNDLTSTQAGISPNVKIQGLGFGLGVAYKF